MLLDIKDQILIIHDQKKVPYATIIIKIQTHAFHRHAKFVQIFFEFRTISNENVSNICCTIMLRKNYFCEYLF